MDDPNMAAGSFVPLRRPKLNMVFSNSETEEMDSICLDGDKPKDPSINDKQLDTFLGYENKVMIDHQRERNGLNLQKNVFVDSSTHLTKTKTTPKFE